MKAVSAILAVVLVCVCAVEDQDVLKQWTKFQADFGKSYRSPVEARKRFVIFQENLIAIKAHNQLFENENGLVSYTMGINQFADWTQGEFRSYVNKGLVNKTETLKRGKPFIKSPNFVEPDSVDWRNEGVVTPVKDQGSCGSCWAFSTTGCLEGQLGLHKELVSLSEQYLVDCSKNGGNGGCNGGLMTSAFEYIKDNGIDSENDYPYKGRNGKCRADEFEPVTKVASYKDIPEGDESALTQAIATEGPISIGIDASMALQFYSSGIFNGYCSSYSLNHGVLAVGFGSENGKEFYIVKNSWGDSWGEQGYFRLARNSNNKCGVASMASYAVL